MAWLEHRYAVRRLDAYVDGELDHEDVDRVISHVLACEHCATQVRFLLEVRASLLRFRSGVEV